MADESAPGGGGAGWPFSAGDYILGADEADSLWGRIQLGALFTDNVKALVALLGGLVAYSVQAVPNAITRLLDAATSFGVDVVDHLFEIPQSTIEQGFVEAVAGVANSGAAGAAAAVLIVGSSALVIGAGVNLLVQ